jgi:hypothetical protein
MQLILIFMKRNTESSDIHRSSAVKKILGLDLGTATSGTI